MRSSRILLGERFEVLKERDDWLVDGLDRLTGRRVFLVWIQGIPCALEMARLARAARKLRGLSSPRLVAPLAEGYAPDMGCWWQAFPVPPGRSMQKQRANSPDLLATTQALCLAVAEAHACGLVLRNLLPSGVFLDPMRPNCAWILAPRPALPRGHDKSLDARSAPSGMTDGAHLDACSDVWNLGALLTQLWAGAVPELTSEHPTRRPASLLSSLFRPEQEESPEALEALVVRCLESTRARRFQDGVQVAHALAPIEGGDAALRARLLALPDAQPEEVDWVEVERFAQTLVEAIHPRYSMQPTYERTEARRMLAAQHLRKGELQKALVVLERALADDPTEEIEQARERIRSTLAQGRSLQIQVLRLRCRLKRGSLAQPSGQGAEGARMDPVSRRGGPAPLLPQTPGPERPKASPPTPQPSLERGTSSLTPRGISLLKSLPRTSLISKSPPPSLVTSLPPLKLGALEEPSSGAAISKKERVIIASEKQVTFQAVDQMKHAGFPGMTYLQEALPLQTRAINGFVQEGVSGKFDEKTRILKMRSEDVALISKINPSRADSYSQASQAAGTFYHEMIHSIQERFVGKDWFSNLENHLQGEIEKLRAKGVYTPSGSSAEVARKYAMEAFPKYAGSRAERVFGSVFGHS